MTPFALAKRRYDLSKAHIQHLEHHMPTTEAHEKDGRLAVANAAQQDPNEQTSISPRAWVVILLCALALLQNTFFSYVLISPRPFLSRGKVRNRLDLDLIKSTCFAGLLRLSVRMRSLRLSVRQRDSGFGS